MTRPMIADRDRPANLRAICPAVSWRSSLADDLPLGRGQFLVVAFVDCLGLPEFLQSVDTGAYRAPLDDLLLVSLCHQIHPCCFAYKALRKRRGSPNTLPVRSRSSGPVRSRTRQSRSS